MSQWLDVCAVDDLQADSGVCALVAGKQIALFYLTRLDAVFAVDNFDPVAQANVLSRGMVGDLAGEPMFASPMYKQHYSLKTGICLEDPQIRIGRYDAKIEGGRVMINMEA